MSYFEWVAPEPMCRDECEGLECEAPPNHAGSHIGTDPETGEPVFWGPGLRRAG